MRYTGLKGGRKERRGGGGGESEREGGRHRPFPCPRPPSALDSLGSPFPRAFPILCCFSYLSAS